jgi:hypothetical protein
MFSESLENTAYPRSFFRRSVSIIVRTLLNCSTGARPALDSCWLTPAHDDVMRLPLRSSAAVLMTIATFSMIRLAPAEASSSGANDSYAQQQLSVPLDTAPIAAANKLLVIAHNAGDAPSTIAQAVSHHAQVVEIDTVEASGQLRARHDVSPRSVNDVVNRSQTAGSAWTSAGTPGILLDLKTSGPATAELVTNPHMLDTLAATSPRALRLLSIATTETLTTFLAQPIDPSIQGVGVAAALLDFITVHTLHQKHLWIQAWTVDTMSRVDALAQLGVNGINTNSLPILSALQNNRV